MTLDTPHDIERYLIDPHNELGKTGLKHYSGTLYEEFLPQLQGMRGIKTYREMAENDPIISACLLAIETLLRSVPWAVEPASSDPADVELATFVEECQQDMSHTWEDFISEILTMLRYGWSYFEITYKVRNGSTPGTPTSRYSDNLIGWRKMAPRSQDTLYRWKIAPDGGIEGLWQYPPPTGDLDSDLTRRTQDPNNDLGWGLIYLPIEKSLLFRTTSVKSSPQGRSLLRSAYRPWYFSKRIQEVEAIGIERDLAGMPIAYVPIELLAENKSTEVASTFNYIRDIVQKTKRDQQEGIMFPLVYDQEGHELFRFELLSTQGRRALDTGAIIQRYSQEKAMSLLADFILLGHENTGSFALSSDKTELFSVAMGSLLDSIEDVLNRHALPRLLRLNGLPADATMPQFRHGDIEKPDLANLITFVSGLASAGAPIFPDIVLENWLREQADMPPITEEERERIMSEQAEAAMAGGAMGAEQPPGMGIKGMSGIPKSTPPQPPGPKAQPNGSSMPNQGGRPTGSSSTSVQKAIEDLIGQV